MMHVPDTPGLRPLPCRARGRTTRIRITADEMMREAGRRPGRPVKRLVQGLGLGFGVSPDGAEARLVIVRRGGKPDEIEVNTIRQAFRVPEDARKEWISEDGWQGLVFHWPRKGGGDRRGDDSGQR